MLDSGEERGELGLMASSATMPGGEGQVGKGRPEIARNDSL